MTAGNTDGGDKNRERIVGQVRERYGRIASKGTESSGCCQSERDRSDAAAALGYDRTDVKQLPEGADLSLGCGAPITSLDLRPGETVLDLGSGAGIDAFLAARQVGPSGRVIGVDMTPEMLDRARANAAASGLDQVEFRAGRLESMPVSDDSIDAVTSNCVINLVPDKAAVFAEIARVLRPGGRLVISDIVLDGELPEEIAADVLAYVGCVAGAMRRDRYFGLLEAAGLSSVEILTDVDFLPRLTGVSGELSEKLRGTKGFQLADLEGVVRSITFRARKP
jgi:SAM-dependent methyltransferase